MMETRTKKAKNASAGQTVLKENCTASGIMSGVKEDNGRSQAAENRQPAAVSTRGIVRLIRIPKEEDRIRAISAWLLVPWSRCGFSDFRYLVMPDHIKALQDAGVPFEDITDMT